jgi:hypothetical protein
VKKISVGTARRFVRAILRLDEPLGSVADALAWLGYVQIDPINVCGRMHDLILRTRVAGYQEGDLFRHVYGGSPRTAFEHYLPGCLVVLPVETFPLLRPRMAARSRSSNAWGGKLTPSERKTADRLLAEIAERGALSSLDFERRGRTISAWGSQTSLERHTLEKLFFHGRLLVSRREGMRRYYDLPERVLPAAILEAPAASDREYQTWLVHLRLQQRRLVRLTKQQLALVADEVLPLRVGDGPMLYIRKQDEPFLDAPSGRAETTLLAPLDPLLYDRELTRQLWDFDYTWEVYTPIAKRKRGYYALPVLVGEKLVGHVDPKADRDASHLEIVSSKVPRTTRLAPAVGELARFLGLRKTRPRSAAPPRPGRARR